MTRATRIRPATPQDVAALLQVRTAVKENHLSLAQLAERGITEATLHEALSGPVLCAWVAEDGSSVVGFAMIDLDAASLFALFVLPTHEGRGIGSALLAYAEQALFAHHPQIWLETARDSRAARLYQARGWGDTAAVGEHDVRLHKHRAKI